MPRLTTNETSGRPREYLYAHEVELLCKGAKTGGHEGARDHALIHFAYAHGLRCSEIINLKWSHVDFANRTFSVHRLKHGKPSLHQLSAKDLKLLKKWQRRQRTVYGGSVYVFTSQTGCPLSRRGVYGVVQRAGERARFPWRVHPHMLRHSRGFALANSERGIPLHQIAHFMGHRDINSTLRYTEIDVATMSGLESVEYKG